MSTSAQAEEGYSIGEQEAYLRKYADLHRWVINDVCIDGGYSGGNLDRPALQRLISHVEQGKVQKVLVYKLDRLSRSQKETMYLIEDVFMKNHVDFVSMTENLDTGTPMGIAMIGIMSVFAQLERAQIKERMQMGLDARMRGGAPHVKANAPVGYRYDGDSVVQTEDAVIVRMVYQMYLDGGTASGIARQLINTYHFRSPRIWQAADVIKMICNPIYKGVQTYKGDEIKLTNIAPIIDEVTWQHAYDMYRMRNGKDTPSKPHTAYNHRTMCGGLVWCGMCGRRYYTNSTKGRVYFRCSRRLRYMVDECSNSGISERILNGIVKAEIAKLHTDTSLLSDITHQTKSYGVERDALESQLTALEQQSKRLLDLYTIGRYDISTLLSKSAEIDAQRADLERRIIAIDDKMSKSNAATFTESLSTFASIVDSCPDADLHDVVHALIRSITITGKQIDIEWNI